MSTEHSCDEGSACGIDFSRESAVKAGFSFGREYLVPAVCLLFLFLGIGLDYFDAHFFVAPLSILWYAIIYLIIGGKVLLKAAKLIAKFELYNEFVLMSVATLGAFFIGAYAEGIAVMLFYVVGELFQEAAVNKAKRSIEALLKVQVEEVTVLENGTPIIKHPKEVEPGQIIQAKAGQKIALDGVLVSEIASLNTAALTGESAPDEKNKGDQILAGMINLVRPIQIRVSHRYEDTRLSKILRLVHEAVGKKAKTQLLISRLAGVYTPIVFWLAIALIIIPYFVPGYDYIFQEWFRRALIFLVISCPCALVISIPLGYFGGIGAGSKNGILFKGSNYLDLMTRVDTVVMDKTGTLTKGVFEVQDVVALSLSTAALLERVALLESHSTHPIAEAITNYTAGSDSSLVAHNIEELSGLGMKGDINGEEVLAGNTRLLEKFDIAFEPSLNDHAQTIIVVAIDRNYVGYISIADTLKGDVRAAVSALHASANIRELIMLSGDKQAVVNQVAATLGIDRAMGGLLPADKIAEVEALKQQGRTVAFVGDGINDAPVIALSDVGIAMGGLGSDAAIETADIIIQTDQPSKIATAIRIGNATNRIIWQNIGLALGVKILVLTLGAAGMATLWEAVIADVGVALLAILNAVRIQKTKF